MFTKRNLINQPYTLSVSQIIGGIIIATGILTLLVISLCEWRSKTNDVDISSLVAIGFLLVMLGIAFYFPDMLKSNVHNATSSLRVAVYMIICVFVFLCVKIGWNCESFSSFQLDSTWAYILAAALGSKTVQSFSEQRSVTQRNAGPGVMLQNTGPDASLTAIPTEPFHNPLILTPPPNDPPANITKSK